jgi:DNA-directed RNA polymerase specialized sigma24 family protein
VRDETWFVELYERRYPAVLAYGVRRIGSEQAREVAAEVFLVVWRRKFDLTEDEELPWLYGIARKVTANLLRSEQRRWAMTQRASSVIATGVAAQLDPMSSVDSVIDVRAALLTLLANEKDVKADGEVIDRSGRRGSASPFSVTVAACRRSGR